MATFKKWIVPGGVLAIFALGLAIRQPGPLVKGFAAAKLAHEISAKCGSDRTCAESFGKTFGAIPGEIAR